MSTLSELTRKPWKSVGDVCKDAAVFLDTGAAELLHWAGGLKLLEGCVGVYDLHSKLNPVARDFIAAAPYCHVIVVVGAFLYGVVSEWISALLSDLQPLECHVFCSHTEEMHAQLIPMSEGEGLGGGDMDYSLDGYSHFGEFQALMRKWINREAGVRVAVQHLPLFHAEVCPGLVTTPTFSHLFPMLPSAVIEIQTRLLNEGVTECSLENLNQVEFDMLTRQFQMQIKSFASGLNSMLAEWSMAEDIFSMGQTSRFIANQLAAMPAAKVRRKMASHNCSVLLIDRTLDVTNPSLHHTDSLADRILSLLPHTSACSSDVSINMAMLNPAQSKNEGWALNGTLAQPNHLKAKQLLRTLICSKQKESLMQVSRSLLDCLSQEGLSVKLTGKLARPSALQLKTFLQQFKDHPEACVSQHAVLQLACAVVEALEGDPAKHWETLLSMEKVLLLNIREQASPSVAQAPPSVAQQLSEEVQKQSLLAGDGTLTLAELLGVGVAMFSLVGVETCLGAADEETDLKEALAALAGKWRSCDRDFLQALGIDRSDLHAAVFARFESVFQRLEGLGTARDHLTQFRHTSTSALGVSPLPYRPLLSQVTEAIFDPGHPELPDLYYHAQGTVTNLLKSGFSLFVSSARPRPNQHPVLLLFVVGGVSCTEVRQIQETVTSSKTDVEVIIGTTRLITSHDLTKEVLCGK